MRSQNQNNLKRKMIIVLIIVLCFVPILFAVTYLIDYLDDRNKMVEEQVIDYKWFEADCDENIYDDEEYVKLIEYGFISYTDGSVTLLIDKDSAKSYGEEIDFMVRYLYSIINGNADEYNSYFSDSYYKYHNKKDSFTMQKLYEVSLTKELVEKVEEKDGEFNRYTFILSYRILKNNGTFRKDIGDGYRRQYITVTDRNGQLLIDRVSTERIIVK